MEHGQDVLEQFDAKSARHLRHANKPRRLVPVHKLHQILHHEKKLIKGLDSKDLAVNVIGQYGGLVS